MAEQSATTRTLQLTIVSPARALYDGDVYSLQAPMDDGLIGILPGHARLVGLMGFGLLTLNDQHGRRHFVIDGGFIEVTPGHVSVLANHGEELENVDVARAQAEFDAARAETAQGEYEVQARLERIAAARTRITYGGAPPR
jgi:F-type H+-transporting ATPase subunit epsilon